MNQRMNSDLTDQYPSPFSVKVIDLTHLRLTSRSLRKMPLHRFTKLQRLCLRQNEISKISEKDVGTLSELRDLDLYDNALGKTYGESLRGCPRLECVR